MVKKTYLLVFSILLVSLMVLFLLLWITERPQPQQESKKTVGQTEEKVSVKDEVRIKRPELIPARPEDYGMKLIHSHNKPQTPEEWDAMFTQDLSELKDRMSDNEITTLKEHIKEDPEKTKEKTEQVDKRLKELERILSKEPYNEEARKQHERLMMLRSIYNGMKGSFK